MPFVRERYPADWKAISRAIRNRSGVTVLKIGRLEMTVTAWARRVGLDKKTIFLRLAKGMSAKRAVMTKAMPRSERGILALKKRGVIRAS